MNALMVILVPVLLLARMCGAADAGRAEGDPPPTMIDTGPMTSIPDGGPIAPGLDTESARSGGACYDGEDNDFIGGTDCDDASCAADSSACCIGSGTCCAVDGFALPAQTFDCTGTLVACDSPFVAFGDPDPWLRDGSFVPGGNSTYDSGAFLSGPGPGGFEIFDLSTRRVTITAEIVPAPGCGATCNEVVGIALTSQALSDTTTLRPVVGLLYSGARAMVTLIVNGAPVGSISHAAEDGTLSYRLDVAPTGEVSAVRIEADMTETEIARSTFVAIRDAKLVLHGRSRNREADPSAVNAGLGQLTVTREICDMPSAWVRGADPVPTRGGFAVENIRSLSAWRNDGAADPRIWVAVGTGTPGGDSGIYLLRTADVTVPADLTLVTTAPFGGNGDWDAGGVTDPEIVYAEGMWHLFYTGIGSDGKRRIGATTFADGAPPAITAPPAAIIDVGPGERAIDQATVLPVEGSPWQLIARVTREDGSQVLVRWERTDPIAGTWTRRDCDAPADGVDESSMATLLCTRTERRPGSGRDAFDADEISSPDLIAYNGSYQLYYAGRSGSRWAVGLLASDDLRFWRDVGEGEAILAGDAQGFDSFGVSSPAVIGVDGGVGMYYLGSDGARTRIGWAAREATSHRAGRLAPPPSGG